MQNYMSLMNDEIYRWFYLLNEEYFDNELPEPMITIQATKQTIKGYFTIFRVWESEELENKDDEDSDIIVDSRYEICLSANWLKITEEHPIEDLVGTLQHELCHYEAAQKGIKDCSGRVHNKKFKKIAEEKQLVVEKAPGVGYGITKPNDGLIDFIHEKIKPDVSVFKFYRVIPEKPEKEKPEKKKFTAWVCPGCGMEAKGEEGMNLMCSDCQLALEPKPRGKRGRKAKSDNGEDN